MHAYVGQDISYTAIYPGLDDGNFSTADQIVTPLSVADWQIVRVCTSQQSTADEAVCMMVLSTTSMALRQWACSIAASSTGHSLAMRAYSFTISCSLVSQQHLQVSIP